MNYDFKKLIDYVISGNVVAVREEVRNALSHNINPVDIITKGLLESVNVIGQRFEKNEIYVTELLVTAKAMHAGLDEIKPYMGNKIDEKIGRIVIGTVAGDLHDIGKNLLILILEMTGFEVIDLGVDVPASSFAEAISKYQPDVICLSALLSTTVITMEETIKALKESRQTNMVPIVVGGAALNQEIAEKIGADGYSPDAINGSKLLQTIIKRRVKIVNPNNLSLIFADNEIIKLQNSFYELTGLNLIIVDEFGKPLSDAGEFTSCSQSCTKIGDEIKKLNLSKYNQIISNFNDVPQTFAYRCRCGMMEVSCPLIGENGQIGSLICGHFLLKNDIKDGNGPKGIICLSDEQCNGLCEYMAIVGSKIVDLYDRTVINNDLGDKEQTFINFIKKQKKLEEELKEAQLSALQYQVNPHFLFNSLNTVARMADIEDAKDTESLVSSLARLMRYSLYQVKAVVTVAEEVKALSDYLKIQEARFQGRISSKLDIESAIMNAKMPCMILQPLVENACQHGLEPCKRGGIVSIQGWIENDQVFLEVSDNGVGMSEELQRDIFKLEIKSEKGGQVSGLGLNNVLRRLQAHFGSDCAWDIKSAINKGTKLQLSFPYIS